MSRRIVYSSSEQTKVATKAGIQGAPEETKQDPSYSDKLLALIPAEIVAAFVAINGMLSSTEVPALLNWIIFAVLLIFTVIYEWRVTTEPQRPAAILQIAIASVAFVIWVYVLGGPFKSFSWYNPIYGSVFAVLYTLGVPFLFTKPHPKPAVAPAATA